LPKRETLLFHEPRGKRKRRTKHFLYTLSHREEKKKKKEKRCAFYEGCRRRKEDGLVPGGEKRGGKEKRSLLIFLSGKERGRRGKTTTGPLPSSIFQERGRGLSLRSTCLSKKKKNSSSLIIKGKRKE